MRTNNCLITAALLVTLPQASRIKPKLLSQVLTVLQGWPLPASPSPPQQGSGPHRPGLPHIRNQVVPLLGMFSLFSAAFCRSLGPSLAHLRPQDTSGPPCQEQSPLPPRIILGHVEHLCSLLHGTYPGIQSIPLVHSSYVLSSHCEPGISKH